VEAVDGISHTSLAPLAEEAVAIDAFAPFLLVVVRICRLVGSV